MKSEGRPLCTPMCRVKKKKKNLGDAVGAE